MRYRISEIKLDLQQQAKDLEAAVRKKLKKKQIKLYDIQIIKESIDARKKPDIKRVYTVEFSCDQKLPLKEAVKREYEIPAADGTDKERPVIAGFGPAGMLAGLILAEAGLKPIILERGEPVEQRMKTVQKFWQEGVLDPESNVQFGEGGAGTFSDGKLTTGIKDIRIGKVLEELVEAGADPNILYKQKPHIGTDKLRGIVKNIRIKIESLGGEVRFGSRLEEITLSGGKEAGEGPLQEVKGVIVRRRKVDGSAELYDLPTSCLILATGHSARDTFEMLQRRGADMEQKPFSIGVRIQHLQETIDEAQYGDPSLAKLLGPAEYKLHHKCENGRGVYTFCMCPGGEIIDSSSEPETAVTNGMSESARDGKYANSGLLVDVRTDDFGSDDPLAGITFQKKYEELAYKQGGGRIPETIYEKFRDDTEDPVRNSLPDFAVESIVEAMPHLGRKLHGFDAPDAVMKAVETRSSSPVRILRDETGQSSIRGLFPAGEGPGYAGGIVSAAVDGIRMAEKAIAVIFPEKPNIL